MTLANVHAGEWVLVIIGVGLALGVAALLVRILGQAFTSAGSTTGFRGILILALSLLTMLAMIGALFTDSEPAWTVAATGVGALAGSLTQLFEGTKDRHTGGDDGGTG